MTIAANDTLITPFEVRRYSPAKSNFDSGHIQNLISIKEEELFNKAFGWDFYNDLMEDRVKYTHTNFQEGTSYTLDSVVMWNEELYQCVQATNGSQKPSDKVYWESAPKFADADYNYIWDRYLKKLLAWNILYTSIMYTAIQATSTGLQRIVAEGGDPADLSEIDAYKREAIKDARVLLNNMDQYIQRNKEKEVFRNYLTIKNECQKPIYKQRKRKYYGFNI